MLSVDPIIPYYVASKSRQVISRWQLLPGSMLHIVGGNGSGKTSLLKALQGLLPYRGKVRWYHQDHQTMLSQLASLPVFDVLPSHLTLEVYMNMHACLQGVTPLIDWPSSSKAFLNKHRFLYQLSSGQQQFLRLWVVKQSKRRLWLLDEPFNHVDQCLQQEMVSIIKQHVESGGMVILTAHQYRPFEGLDHQREERLSYVL
jgi:heme exporter protein A